MSASVGILFAVSRATADMIWPDWQYPHWGTSISVQTARTVSVTLPFKPSMVVIVDGGDRRAVGVLDESLTGPDGFVVQVNSARAALCKATAELRAAQSGQITDRPKQGHIPWRIHFVDGAVDVEFRHSVCGSLSWPMPCLQGNPATTFM